MKAMEAAFTASPVIGPVMNWSSSSLGIFGSAALLAAMAAFFNFVLQGRQEYDVSLTIMTDHVAGQRLPG